MLANIFKVGHFFLMILQFFFFVTFFSILFLFLFYIVHSIRISNSFGTWPCILLFDPLLWCVDFLQAIFPAAASSVVIPLAS